MKRANRLTLVAGMMPDAIASAVLAMVGLSNLSSARCDGAARPVKPVTP